MRFQMADISTTGEHCTHGQHFLTNKNIDCFTVSEERNACPPLVSIAHSLHYMAQMHASTSELCWSLTPDCDNVM